jgi:hypothetical protein
MKKKHSASFIAFNECYVRKKLDKIGPQYLITGTKAEPETRVAENSKQENWLRVDIVNSELLIKTAAQREFFILVKTAVCFVT